MSNFARLDNNPPRDGEYVPPIADSFRVHFCGACPNAHILLLNAKGEGFAQMIMSGEQAARLLLNILQQKGSA